MDVPAQNDAGPDFLTHWTTRPDSRAFLRDGAGSFAVHVIVVALALVISSLPDPPSRRGRREIDLTKAVHLTMPLTKLTQKEPNTSKVAKELNVEQLQARNEKPQPPQPQRHFTPPPPAPPASAPKPPPVIQPDTPKLEAKIENPLPQIGSPQAPPPKPQEPPKLALEAPGQNGVVHAPGQVRIPPPKTSVEDAIRSAVHPSQGGNISVGDEDQPPSISEQLRHPSAQRQLQTGLQLLSDSQGVDFKPYLIRILSIVRRNWLAIIPESAHMGRRGRVLLQFIIDRGGAVPKLVIAMPSGTEAFDRAAVAGISASVPFPPLPPDFKGGEVRLQFAFQYNMK